MTDLPIVDLDVLVRPVARIKLFGTIHEVLPVDGRAADMLHQIADQQKANGDDDGNGNRLGLLYYDLAREVVGNVVPTLSLEDRTRLTIEQSTAIIGLATKQVAAIEDAITASAEGNGHRATAGTTPGSGAGSTIPSPASSSASLATPGGRSSKSRTNRSR